MRLRTWLSKVRAGIGKTCITGRIDRVIIFSFSLRNKRINNRFCTIYLKYTFKQIVFQQPTRIGFPGSHLLSFTRWTDRASLRNWKSGIKSMDRTSPASFYGDILICRQFTFHVRPTSANGDGKLSFRRQFVFIQSFQHCIRRTNISNFTCVNTRVDLCEDERGNVYETWKWALPRDVIKIVISRLGALAHKGLCWRIIMM